jgi:hypothetical protein
MPKCEIEEMTYHLGKSISFYEKFLGKKIRLNYPRIEWLAFPDKEIYPKFEEAQ